VRRVPVFARYESRRLLLLLLLFMNRETYCGSNCTILSQASDESSFGVGQLSIDNLTSTQAGVWTADEQRWKELRVIGEGS
jgi:hypothetical protein